MIPIFANSAGIRVPEKLVLQGGRRTSLNLKTRYGVVVHPTHGPVLIDSGYGPSVTEGRARSLALKAYARMTGPALVPDGAPDVVLRRLGYSCDAVRTIVLTHFHADHVAGLSLFPNARIMACRTTFDAIQARSELANLRHGIFKELLPGDLTDRIVDVAGLKDVQAPLRLGPGKDLLGDGSLLAIDLPGHAEGHFGLCFACLEKPLLYAVDVQWVLKAVVDQRLPGFPANLVATDAEAGKMSAKRVAQFRAKGGDVVLCHDPEQTPYDLPETSNA